MRRAFPFLLIHLALAAPAGAAVPVEKSPDLWATVNVCDTPDNPNRIGIRGSMPGLGRTAVLSMRFQVQFLARSDGKWHNIAEKADSGFRRVGETRSRVLESGFTFRFRPPAAGGAHTMRGAVTFVWRRDGRVLKKLREITEAGHRSTKGADPAGFSAAICQIS